MIAAAQPSVAEFPALGQAPPLGWILELRCSDVHPVTCDVRLRSFDPLDLRRLACEHGARAHGFTPAWYSAERIAAIAAATSAMIATPCT